MTGTQRRTGLSAVARRLIPESLLRQRDIFFRLGPTAGPTYVRLRLLDAVGIHSANRERIQPNARSLLFVCYGNIMRSPMAEMLMRKSLAAVNLSQVQVTSAGLQAVPGNAAHPRAIAAAEELGISLSEHRARLLTDKQVAEADAIFAMDFQNKAELLAIYPDAKDKILMLSAYAEGAQRFREIPDPYFGDLHTARRCYGVLQTCIRKLTLELAGYALEATSESVSS